MSFGLEIMIIVALLVYVVTGLVGIGLLVMYLRVFGPVMKLMTKQWKRMYSEIEAEQAEEDKEV